MPKKDRLPSRFIPRYRGIINWNTKKVYYMNTFSDNMLVNATINWNTREWINEKDFTDLFEKQGFTIVRRPATLEDLLQKSSQEEQEFEAEILDKKEFELDDTVFFRIRFKGWLRQGFFDCEIIPHAGGVPYWSFHPKTLKDGNVDTAGELHGFVDENLTWGWHISTFYPTGYYTIYLRVYDHIDRGNRPVIAQLKETIEIIPRRQITK